MSGCLGARPSFRAGDAKEALVIMGLLKLEAHLQELIDVFDLEDLSVLLSQHSHETFDVPTISHITIGKSEDRLLLLEIERDASKAEFRLNADRLAFEIQVLGMFLTDPQPARATGIEEFDPAVTMQGHGTQAADNMLLEHFIESTIESFERLLHRYSMPFTILQQADNRRHRDSS